MIEFRFRGISKETGDLVTGDLVHMGGMPAINPIGSRSVVAINDGTLGQDTGMRDAGGNPIFEGDIVEDAGGRRILIARDKEAPAFVGLSPMAIARNKEHICSSARYLAASSGEMHIIGNIHQNPKLMQV